MTPEHTLFLQVCHTRKRMVDSYTGCNIPAKETLINEGWEFRCNTDELRLNEVIDVYKELGYEIHLEPINLEGLSEDCDGCAGMLSRFKAVYTRKFTGYEG